MSSTISHTFLSSKLQLSNILTMTLNQSVLESNFSAILQALSDHDKQLLQNVQMSTKNMQKIKQVAGSQNQMQKELKQLKKIVMEMKNNRQNDRENPESPVKGGQYEKLIEDVFNLKHRCTQNEKNITNNMDITNQQITKLKQEIKKQTNQINETENNDLSLKFKQLQKNVQSNDISNKKLNERIIIVERDVKDLSKRLSKDQQNYEKLLQTMNSLTKTVELLNNNFNKQQIDQSGQLQNLHKKINEIDDTLEEQKKLKSKLGQQIWKIHENLSKISKNNINFQMFNDQFKLMKNQLSQLSKKVADLQNQNTKLMFDFEGVKSSKQIGQMETNVKQKSTFGNMDLKQDMIERMKSMKSEILRNVKKNQVKKQDQINLDKRKIENISDEILKLQHLVSEKANIESVKKLISNIESKMSYIFDIILGQAKTEDDARIARRNWTCLSCDKKLDNYKGKIGNHLVSNQLKAKALQQQVIGGGMMIKCRSKVDLPKVYNQSAKK